MMQTAIGVDIQPLICWDKSAVVIPIGEPMILEFFLQRPRRDPDYLRENLAPHRHWYVGGIFDGKPMTLIEYSSA